MKTLKNLTGILFAAIFIMAFTTTSYAGDATASATANGGEQCGCISSVKTGAGALTIKSITVTDLYGKETVLKPSEYTIEGNGSTSPTIKFHNPLAENSHVYVEMTTSRTGDHGYMKMTLKKPTSTRNGIKCNC
ncbi:MAG: hypothetical protein AAF502_20365 [Bacteroidota bacterium]